jgi:hypothetical protein
MPRPNYVKEEIKYIEEVAKIKSFELFGIDGCGVSWYQLGRKHLAFDVLKCASDLSCSGSHCLEDEISRECNC